MTARWVSAPGDTIGRVGRTAMDRLDDLETFLAIVEKGGQTAAARHLHRSLQSIGRSLAALERSVGTELIRRTKRRPQATEAGLAFSGPVRAGLRCSRPDRVHGALPRRRGRLPRPARPSDASRRAVAARMHPCVRPTTRSNAGRFTSAAAQADAVARPLPHRHAAVAGGLGIGYTPLWQVRELVDRGRVRFSWPISRRRRTRSTRSGRRPGSRRSRRGCSPSFWRRD